MLQGEQFVQVDEVNKHQLRKTKIICSINENSNNFDLLRQMIIAGANAFSVNMAYLQDRAELKKINSFRLDLENEFKRRIPLNIILRGTIVRVGRLTEPEIHVEQGQPICLSSCKQFIGDNRIIGIDSEEFFDQVRMGDKIAIDYGQIIMEVQELTDMYTVMNEINKHESFRYDISEFEKEQLLNTKGLCCITQNSGKLRPYKPINIYEDSKNRRSTIEFLGESTQLSFRDQEDIQYAVSCQFDSITVANVLSPIHIINTRKLIGADYQHVQVFGRIATKVRIDTLEKILRESDGCIIARSYISMNSPVEDIVKYQSIIIEQCRRLLKPVFISTQILESMLTSLKPSFAEMGDISNVVRQYIDGIMLSGETSFGKHPFEVVRTLDRVIKNIEKRVITENQMKQDNREHSLINYSGKPVASVIAQSSVEMAYILPAKAIILLTVTVGTALKISKLRSPCQIIALTRIKSVCRCLNYINGVTSSCEPSFENEDKIISLKIAECLKMNLLQKDDFVVVLSGSNDSEYTWHIDQMKVIRA